MIFERDSLSTVICNIRTPVGNSEETGTAIFIEKNNEPFLLTASHVLGNLSDNSYAVLSDKNGAPSKVPLSILLGGATFIHHNKADLAKAKINITLLNAHFWRGRCFLYDLINTTTNLVSKDTELTTIGFPLGLGVEGQKFSPLSFRTFAA